MALDRAQRKAAGVVCLSVFHILSSGVVHTLRMMVDDRISLTSATGGLTVKEQELIQRKMKELSDTADIFRRLGWRLLK
jgi:hypothetical protein